MVAVRVGLVIGVGAGIRAGCGSHVLAPYPGYLPWASSTWEAAGLVIGMIGGSVCVEGAVALADDLFSLDAPQSWL